MQRQQSGGRARATIFLVGSLLLALVAALIVFNVIRQSQLQMQEAKKPKETVPVVIAVRDLYMGLPIAADDVVVKHLVPEMVLRDQTFADLETVLALTPRERILANEPIRKERLASASAGVGLNAIVTPGKRAMTIATDTETAVAGLLTPGNFVDVIVTIKPEDPLAVGAKYVAETILQEIRVLAVGSSLGGNAAKEQESKDAKKKKGDATTRKLKPSITVEVTPEEAEKLALAQTRGEIHVVLRSDIDILQIDSHGLTTTGQLIGYDDAQQPVEPIKRRRDAPPAPPAPVVPKAELISGSDKTEVSFNPDGTTDVTNDSKRRK
jgi:pilus assembly protein CpaB